MRKVYMLIVLSLVTSATIFAQPTARRQQQAIQKSTKNALSTRAQLSFPTAQKMNDNAEWRRDIYREIDLTKPANSGLYYPVEPIGSQMNLFTYLFKLVLSGQLKAYEYRLDGNESFEKEAQVKPLTLLDNYSIYYERKDGRLKLDNSDIPSAEVKAYYVKESAYYDQVTATYHKKIVALCPIMKREDDFGSATYPLFWVKYDDAAPFLAKQTIMTSDINNAAAMSVDDYFVKNMYEGSIYKTNNMLGRTLAQYCEGDSAMLKEQQRIEQELQKFEENIWGDKARKDSLDSIANIVVLDKKAMKKAKRKEKEEASSNNSDSKENSKAEKKSEKKAVKQKKSKKSSQPSARISVRRERR